MNGQLTMGSRRKAAKWQPEASLIPRLAAARYGVLFIGVGVLLWEAAQVLWLGRSVTMRTMTEVALISQLVPMTVWAVSREEHRLRREMEKQTQHLEQRAREIRALNQLFQDHLAEATGKFPEQFPPLDPSPRIPAQEAPNLARGLSP